MSDPFNAQGHGPADPFGYLVEETPEGWGWTRRADGHVEGSFDSREDAVAAAEADRTS